MWEPQLLENQQMMIFSKPFDISSFFLEWPGIVQGCIRYGLRQNSTGTNIFFQDSTGPWGGNQVDDCRPLAIILKQSCMPKATVQANIPARDPRKVQIDRSIIHLLSERFGQVFLCTCLLL